MRCPILDQNSLFYITDTQVAHTIYFSVTRPVSSSVAIRLKKNIGIISIACRADVLDASAYYLWTRTLNPPSWINIPEAEGEGQDGGFKTQLFSYHQTFGNEKTPALQAIIRSVQDLLRRRVLLLKQMIGQQVVDSGNCLHLLYLSLS